MTIDLPALADLIGVTPETHPHLNNQAHCSDYGCGFTDAEQRCLTFVDHCNCMVCQQCGAEYPVSMNLPGPDRPEAFDNWALAPLMRWLGVNRYSTILLVHLTGNGATVKQSGWVESKVAMTHNVILATRAAGVPEIVALFKEDDHANQTD
jgi:hypothetical protein